MERVYFTEHKGKKILIEDFSNLKPGDEFFQTISLAKKTIASQPQKSVLAVLNASGASYNTEILNLLKEFVQANTPYVRHATVVGITGLLEIGLTVVTKAAGRPLKSLASVEEAMDWLVEQP